MGLFSRRPDAAARNEIRTLMERVQRCVAILNETDEPADYYVAWNRMGVDLEKLLDYERAGQPFTPSIAETCRAIREQKAASERAMIDRADAANRRAVKALSGEKARRNRRDNFFGTFAMYDNQMEPESLAYLAELKAAEAAE